MLDLNLKAPIIIYDLETTGTNKQIDRIVEISVIKVTPEGKEITNTRRINPEMPIPKEASEVHGIYDEDIKDAPTFKDIAEKLYKFFDGCDLAGFNITGFDNDILINEFKRVGYTFDIKNRKIIDSFTIFRKMEPRTLIAAYKYYCGKDLTDAHSAEADTRATLEVLEGQLQKYSEDDLPHEIDKLHEFCNAVDPTWCDSAGRFKWSGGEVVINFGKNRGTQLKEVAINNPNFLKWIIREDFAEDTKAIASNALVGKFPEKKEG
jgi:DNA polymerase-3 subunit epsilon